MRSMSMCNQDSTNLSGRKRFGRHEVSAARFNAFFSHLKKKATEGQGRKTTKTAGTRNHCIYSQAGGNSQSAANCKKTSFLTRFFSIAS